jgi:hypothetical protein
MEIIVEVQKDRVRAIETGARNETAEPGQLDFDPLRMKTIEVFVDRLVRDEPSTRKELEVLGEHLYCGLLTGQVREFVETRLEAATESQKVQLRLKLSYPEQLGGTDLHSRLATLPWEYLYSPTLKTFLVQKVSLVLSRYLPPEHEQAAPDDDELRIGLLFADPMDPDLGTIDARKLIEAVESLANTEGILVERPAQPTPDGLVDLLHNFRPQVLHFIGHGGFERGEEGAKIILQDAEGDSLTVPAYQLGDFFEDARHTPEVVLLDLPDPQGGSKDLQRNAARLGPRLIAAGVPAVVAMQYPFPTKASIAFSKAFYKALANAEHIDIAVTRGRLAYQRSVEKATETRMLGTPVLYAASHHAVKRPVAGRDEEPTPDREPAVAKPPPSEQKAGDAGPGSLLRSDFPKQVPSAGNGAAQRESLLNAIRHTGRSEMSRLALPNESRATVWQWFSRLDRDFDEQTTAGLLADFIHDEWVDGQDDEQLVAVAKAMEETVRRAAQ